MTFFIAVVGGFDVLIKNMKKFLIFALAVSLFLAVVQLLLGQETFCINSEYFESHYCGETLFPFVLSQVLQFVVLVVFMRIWYQCVLTQKQSFSYKMIIPQTTDVKTIGLFLFLAAAVCISLFSLYLLYIREPNPDWRMEAVYFFIVSLGFVVPILALRFISWFAFNLDSERLPSIKETWKKTAGLTMKIFIGITFFMLFFSLISNMIVQYSFSSNHINSCGLAFFVEWLTRLVSLSLVAVFTNIAYIQKQILFERD